VIEALRGSVELRDVPVIAISASPAAPEVDQCLAAGANAFIPKPIDFERLQQAVGELLGITWTLR